MYYSDIKKIVEFQTNLVDTQIVCAVILSLDWLDKITTDEEFDFICSVVRNIYMGDSVGDISIGKIADVVCCGFFGEYYFEEKLFGLKELKKGLSNRVYNKLYNNIYDI